jgi:hypothetical protein
MRRSSICALACASTLLAACGGALQSASLRGSFPPTASASISPSDALAPSLLPSTSPGLRLTGFGFNDILRVEVNHLAARIGPYTFMPLTKGWTWNGSGYDLIGDVRLNAGDFVSVELGPVMIGDTTWYRVWPAEGGFLHHSTVAWNANSPMDGSTNPAWVAAAVGPDTYVSLHEAYEYDRSTTGLPPALVVSGAGDYLSEPLENHDLIGLQWIFLIDDQTAPCDFTVTLEPTVSGASLKAVDKSLTGASESGAMSLGAGDGKPVAGEGFDPFRVRVQSGCEWSILLEWMAHD